MKRRVIIVTDGDKIAQEAVEQAASNIGARCISASAGNPTVLRGSEIISLIKISKYDPVVVMVDDKGNRGMGAGEMVMFNIINSEDIQVMGIIAVASNTQKARGVRVDCSVDKHGRLINHAVDKYGNKKNNSILKGDTVNILSLFKACYVVGIGDPGKMDGGDNIHFGAPIITKAMEEIIRNYNVRLTEFEI